MNNVIRLTVNIKKDEITEEEFKYTLYQLDRVLQEMWGEAAQLTYSQPEKLEEDSEIVTYGADVEAKLREYLTEFGIDPATVIKED